MAATIDLKELTPAQRRALGKRLPRQKGMSVHEVRTYAIKVMNVMAELTPTERARILRHAAKLNEV